MWKKERLKKKVEQMLMIKKRKESVKRKGRKTTLIWEENREKAGHRREILKK